MTVRPQQAQGVSVPLLPCPPSASEPHPRLTNEVCMQEMRKDWGGVGRRPLLFFVSRKKLGLPDRTSQPYPSSQLQG